MINSGLVFSGPFISHSPTEVNVALQLLKTQFDRLSFLHNSCFRKTVRVRAQGIKPASLCVNVGWVLFEASICRCHCGWCCLHNMSGLGSESRVVKQLDLKGKHDDSWFISTSIKKFILQIGLPFLFSCHASSSVLSFNQPIDYYIQLHPIILIGCNCRWLHCVILLGKDSHNNFIICTSCSLVLKCQTEERGFVSNAGIDHPRQRVWPCLVIQSLIVQLHRISATH